MMERKRCRILHMWERPCPMIVHGREDSKKNVHDIAKRTNEGVWK